MQRTLINLFIFSAGVLLLITAVAKIVSANGDARILQMPDPVLAISFRHIFWIVGIVELLVVYVCLFDRHLELQSALVGWLATSFILYRCGRWWVGYYKPCSCLGNLTDALHIPPQTADTAMKIILAYLLIGSYATLFWLWRQKRKALSAAPLSKTTGSAA